MSETKSTKYVALLRGINVGGNKKVPMAELKKALESNGYNKVKTLLASGNVIFEAPQQDLKPLTEKITKLLQETFNFSIPVIIRLFDEIKQIIEKDPFSSINVTKDIRLYLTFLPDEPIQSNLKIPHTSADNSFNILTIINNTIISVLDLSKTGTIDGMAILEKEFGKNITTRNWNTVVKIGAL